MAKPLPPVEPWLGPQETESFNCDHRGKVLRPQLPGALALEMEAMAVISLGHPMTWSCC